MFTAILICVLSAFGRGWALEKEKILEGIRDAVPRFLTTFGDKKVRECDNFYRFICRSHPDDKNFTENLMLEQLLKYARISDEVVKVYQKEDIWKLISDLQEKQYAEKSYNKTVYEKELASRCKLNWTCYEDIYTTVYNFVKNNPDLFEPQAVLSLAYVFNMTMTSPIKNSTNNDLLISEIAGMAHQISYILDAFDNISFKEEVKKAMERLYRIADLAKAEVKRRIVGSVWTTELISDYGISYSQFLEAVVDQLYVQIETPTKWSTEYYQNLYRNFTNLLAEELAGRTKTTSLDGKLALAKAEQRTREAILKEKNGEALLASIEEAHHSVFFSEITQEGTILVNTANTPLFVLSENFVFSAAIFTDELVHQIYRSLYSRSRQWMADFDVYTAQDKCVAQYMGEICNIFREGLCMSGERTVKNDVPLLEHLDAALDVFLQFSKTEDNGIELLEVEGDNGKVEQMSLEKTFFFAVGAYSCRTNADEKPLADIEHKQLQRKDMKSHVVDDVISEEDQLRSLLNGHVSAWYAQVNGAFKQSSAFTKAFNCDAKSNMFAREKSCSVYTTPPGETKSSKTSRSPNFQFSTEPSTKAS